MRKTFKMVLVYIKVSFTNQEMRFSMSLYDDLGGAKALSAVVDSFYSKVLKDSRVNGYFDAADTARQRKKQKATPIF